MTFDFSRVLYVNINSNQLGESLKEFSNKAKHSGKAWKMRTSYVDSLPTSDVWSLLYNSLLSTMNVHSRVNNNNNK